MQHPVKKLDYCLWRLWTYDPLGEFLVVDETDMSAEEMGETLVEERFDSFCASLSMRR